MIPDSARRQILDASRCVVALSGGLDSVVLLDLVAGLNPRSLVALHVDHQLYPASTEVADFCRGLCRKHQVEIEVIRVEVDGRGSLEARAREARYAAFEDFLAPGDLLLQAHHADDQVETLMLSLFRGSRAPGLRGMPGERNVGRACLARPLLDIRRADILQYAQDRALSWREDPTNTDLSIDRNYIRHHILPSIDARFPQARAAMIRGLHRDMAFEKRLAEADHQALLTVRNEADCLALAALRKLPPDRVQVLLDCWLTSLDIPRVSGRCLDEMATRILKGETIDMTTGGIMFRQHDGRLYVLKVLPEHSFSFLPLGSDETGLPDGVLSNEVMKGGGLRAGPDYQIRFRRGGEHIRIGRSRSLKNLFQEKQVPVWLRDRVPLIYAQTELVAVAGLGDWDVPMLLADNWGAAPGSTGLNLVARFRDRVFRGL